MARAWSAEVRRLSDAALNIIDVSCASVSAGSQVHVIWADRVYSSWLFASAQLFHQFPLSHRVGVKEGAFLYRYGQESTILWKSQASNRLPTITREHECLFYFVLRLEWVLSNGYYLNSTRSFNVLHGHGKRGEVFVGMNSDLTLFGTSFDHGPYRVLRHYIFSLKASWEVEYFDTIIEDDYDPVAIYMKIDYF